MMPPLVPDIQIEVFKAGHSVYKGRWQDAPEPVCAYIAAAERHYGEGLRAYLIAKPDPIALLYRGYSYQVI